MSRILVEYGPNISEVSEKNISGNVTPSMEAVDGSSNQYQLEYVLECIKNDDFKIGSETDLIELKKLMSEGVEYIEF